MSARPWRLVRLRPTVPHVPVVAPGTLARRVALAVLPPIAERVRGRFGVHVLRLPGRVLVVAESMDALRGRVYRDRPAMTRRVGRVTLRALWWRGPWRGWSGRVSPHPHLIAERVRLPRLGRGPATVDIRVEWPQPAGPLLAAAEAALRPHAAGAASSPQWPVAAGPTVAAPARVLVDAQVVNPRGRKVDADQPGARRFRLDFDPRGRGAPTLQQWRRGRGDRLTWPAIAALRGIGAIECPVVPGHDPRAEATLLAQLAMTGVVVHAPNLPSPVRDLIASELTAILAEPLESTVDNLGFEVRSVRQRRTALRWHSTRFGPHDDAAALPSVSALLATRRREYLDTILPAIAGQTYPNLEIVLCLHGMDLPESAKVFLDSCARPYEVVRVDGDEAFGNALGLATARAGGALVTKFDDDDTYGPEHIWDLVLARHYAAATMVGKGAEFVYLEDAKVTVRRWSGKPEWDDTMVAGGTMLIDKADLEELGGWRPVARSVDRGLLDRVNRAGATVYRTHPLGYLYHRRPQGHTWDPGTEFFLQNTRQRWDGLMCPDGG